MYALSGPLGGEKNEELMLFQTLSLGVRGSSTLYLENSKFLYSGELSSIARVQVDRAAEVKTLNSSCHNIHPSLLASSRTPCPSASTIVMQDGRVVS